jgi:hypothetical protein
MKEKCMTRGEFMRSAVRAALLGVLAGLCAVFSKRRSPPPAACDSLDACRECRVYDECPVRRTQGGGSR